MHVLLTTNFSPWSRYSGGGQHSTHNLAVALSGRGHEVAVVYTKPPWERLEVPAALPYRIHWAALPAVRSRRAALLRPASALSVAWTVRRFLRLGTVVHASGEEAALLPRLRRSRPFPLVLTPRYPSYPPLLPASGPLQTFQLLFTAPKFFLLGLAVRGADVCCPTSRSAAQMLQQAYDLAEVPIRVVPNGVSPAFLSVTRAPEAAGGPVLFFGRLSRAKGADVLLEALALLGDAAPHTLIIGRGEAYDALVRGCGRLGLTDRVAFRDWMDPTALAAELSRASMAVLPSREESFGNAMAEAMAAGTPVVSTTAGSIPEVVEQGRSGLLVPPDDPAALAQTMRRLLADPAFAQRLGRSGWQRVRDCFTWNRVAQQFEEIYEAVQT